VNPRQRRLRLEQLDAKLSRLSKAFREMPRPKSWIKEIRQALGMSTYALARRLGVRQPSAALIEQNEMSGKVTLATLSRYAEALGCELVHVLIPKDSLTETVERRIDAVARRIVERTAHSMALELQQPTKDVLDNQAAMLSLELERTLPRWLWNDR